MEGILRHLALVPGQVKQADARRAVVLGQLPFTIVLLLVTVVDPGLLAALHYQLGVALTLALLVAGLIVPWEKFAHPWYLVIPLLDFLAVGLLRVPLSVEVLHLALLVVFPVVWLASSVQLPRWGLLAGFLGTVAVLWAPLLTTDANAALGTPAQVSRALMMPVVMVALAATIRLMADSMRAKDARVGALLEDTARREALLQTVLDAVSVGVLAVDRQGREILSNRQQQHFHQLARREDGDTPDPAFTDESGWLVFDVDGCTSLPADRWPIQRALRGETFSDQLLQVGDKPHQRMLSCAARNLKNNEGGVEGAVLAFTDVTDLVAAINARDDLLANVSHELKTPLTVILGNAEMLLDDDPAPAHRRDLEAIERNSLHLLGLVEDLLYSVKKTGIRPVRANLADIINHSAQDARRRARAKGISIRTDVPASLQAVCDPLRIRQVLDNLLSNAIKYSPEDTTVTIQAGLEEGHVLCRVIDQGIGMDARTAEEAFTKFYRSSAARQAAIPGMGLGLAIAKMIIEQHRGDIRCRSTPGEGTAVSFTLPLHQTAPASPASR